MSIFVPATIGAIAAPASLIIIAAVALLIFGPTKLPQLGRSVGTTVKEFKEGFSGLSEDDKDSKDEKKEDTKEEIAQLETKEDDETIKQ